MAVITEGIGDYSKLSYRSMKTPTLEDGGVLLKVLAAGVNNTDINTRIGWYSKDPDNPTGYGDAPSPFPLVQGTDGFGVVVSEGDLSGKRVLVRSSTSRGWYGSDFSAFFQQYVPVRSYDVYEVPSDCTLTPAQLGVIPCAYGTAENILIRASVCEDDIVLVPGCSGGVAGACLQLCLARGCKRIIGITSTEVKAEWLRGGFSGVEITTEVPEGEEVTVVVDNVGGEAAKGR